MSLGLIPQTGSYRGVRKSIHRKKSFSIFPSPAGMSLTKVSLGGNNFYMTSLFPAMESLISDIPAGDGNIEKLFNGVGTLSTWYTERVLYV
jgi:hypothetical protein